MADMHTPTPVIIDASLVQRLNGIYRVPITDGLGAVGSGEEPNNPNEFVRRFDVPPIHREAAGAIAALLARASQDAETIKALRDALEDCERAATGLTPNNAVSYIRGRARAALAGSAS